MEDVIRHSMPSVFHSRERFSGIGFVLRVKTNVNGGKKRENLDKNNILAQKGTLSERVFV